MNFKNLEKVFDIKKSHKDVVIILRCGDYYEAYGDDAKKIADKTRVTLNEFNECGVNIPFVSFPHYGLDNVLPRIIRAGERVIIHDGE